MRCAVGAHQDGHGQRDLRFLAVFALDVAADQQIEFLLGGAELDVGLQRDRVVGLQQRIEQFVHGDGLIVVQTRAEVLAFQHARQAIMRAETNHVVAGQFSQPLAVVADLGALAIEDLVDLLEIGFRVGAHLLGRERRTRFGLAGGIADHGREIADQKNRGVALVLKVLELAQHDGVAQVQVRRGGIDAELDAQRLARLRASVRAWRVAPLRE